MTRVYAPMSLEALGEFFGTARVLAETGDDDFLENGMTVTEGHAVTDELRRAFPDLDDEALEHYAMTEAAQESLEMVTSDDGWDRRLVVAVEVAAIEPRPGGVTAVETQGGTIPRDVVAYMVDTDDAVADVGRAAVAIRLGEDDADELAQRCLDHELGWYAATEVDVVLGLS